MVNMKVVVMAFAMILMLAGMPVSVQAQAETGLVGEWHFDGDAKDSSGNGNDGIINGASFVDGRFGKDIGFGIYNTLAYPMWDWAKSRIIPKPGLWYHVVGTRGDEGFGGFKIYINGVLKESNTIFSTNPDRREIKYFIIGASSMSDSSINGIIDEVKFFDRELTAEEIRELYEKGQKLLSVKKEVSPYSIRQYKTATVTIYIKNIGDSEINNIEVMDLINSNLDLLSGEFPNPKKLEKLGAGESREIRYILKSKESGTFILNSVKVSYPDEIGNIKIVQSDPVSLTVFPASEVSPENSPTSEIGSSSAVLLHGEKTDVVLGEDILLKLSAVNLITKPPMSVQVMIYPPSGMSVTGSEFVKSGAGIYTTTYTLNPGDGKDIEVHIKSNQVGDFNVKGRIVYYFGEEKDKAEDQAQASTSNPSTAGFEAIISMIGIFLVSFLRKKW